MTIKGLDIGYQYTKDNEKRIFKSAFTYEDTIITNGIKIKVDGMPVTVGVGKGTIKPDKTDSELTKMCLLANLAQSNDNQFRLVVGLPISQYQTQKNKLLQSINKNNKTFIEYDGCQKTITIDQTIVFPQCAGSLYAQPINNDVIIVDIGSLTVDFASFEFNNQNYSLLKYNTLFKGTFVLYSEIISAVNAKFNLTLDSQSAEKIITRGLEINGERQNMEFLKPIYLSHIQSIVDELILNYDVSTTKLLLTGGGSMLLGESIQRRIPHAVIMRDCQFSNALGFYQVGLNTFKSNHEIASVTSGGKSGWSKI